MDRVVQDLTLVEMEEETMQEQQMLAEVVGTPASLLGMEKTGDLTPAAAAEVEMLEEMEVLGE